MVGFFTFMQIEIKGFETGITFITLSYNGRTFTTACFFQEEAGEKIQMLIDEALKQE